MIPWNSIYFYASHSLKPATGRASIRVLPSNARQVEDASRHRLPFCGLRYAFEQPAEFPINSERLNASLFTSTVTERRSRTCATRATDVLSNASMVSEDAGPHMSPWRCRIKEQTKRKQNAVNAGWQGASN